MWVSVLVQIVERLGFAEAAPHLASVETFVRVAGYFGFVCLAAQGPFKRNPYLACNSYFQNISSLFHRSKLCVQMVQLTVSRVKV